jgi:SAM-dependent methyltransferase
MPQQKPPTLFDTDLLARRRRRAASGQPALFLHEAAASEIAERLSEVTKSFRAPAVIGPQAKLWANILSANDLGDVRTLPDEDLLPLGDATQDLIVHALALHWANDPVGQLVQSRRALMPDGLFFGVLFGGDTLHELRASVAEAEVAAMGGLSPRIAPMGEIRDLGGLLQRAGFALPVADSLRFNVLYPSAKHLMRDLRAMGETNVMGDRLRRPMPKKMLDACCEIYGTRFPGPDGTVRATFEMVVLTGWAPAPGQPQPLRPGSARMRLAEALQIPHPPGANILPDSET